MPPAGKFPRFAISAALLLILLMVLDLEFVRNAVKSLLISDSIDLLMVAVASCSSFYAFRRSSGYARQLWLLVSIALILETFGQAVSIYYQNFVPGSALSPWPSDVLFFIWAAPIFVIFLPPSEDESPGIDSLRLLDFLQIAILAVTIYLYFFYSPSRWRTNQPALLRQILLVYASRDLILSLAFFFRSRASIPPWLRSFCFTLGAAFLVLVFADMEYLLAIVNTRVPAGWGDLIWLIPNLIIILYAVRWTRVEPTPFPSSPSRIGSLLSSQIFPFAIPLLVIFMSRAIAREQVVLGWLAVTASVVCSSARQILGNVRQRRIAGNLLNTEKALRVSEQLLSTAFRFSPDAFSINPFPNGPYLEVNDGYTRLTGYTREETMGKTPRQMNLWLHPSERDQVLQQLKHSGHVRDFEFHFRRKSGEIRIGQMYASVIELDGQPCSLVVVRDITERKEAEEILRTSEQRFRSLVQNLQVGIVTYDSQGRVVFANQAVLNLVGMPLEQVVGKKSGDLGITAIQENGSLVPDDLRPVPLVIASRKPVRGLLMGWRIPNRPDVWTLLDLVPEFSSTGELLRIVVSVTDLTQQRRALEALRESEERFRTLVENLHIGIIIYDPQVRVLFANQSVQDAFGGQYQHFLGKTTDELGLVTLREDGSEILPADRPVPIVLATKKAVRSQVLGVRPRSSNNVIWTLLDAIPEFNAAGEISRVIVSVTDVTEQRRAAEALRESEERFRTLVRDLHVAVVLHRPDDSIEFANAAAYRMFGIPEGTAIGKTAVDLGIVPVTEDGKDVRYEDRPVPYVVRTRAPVENGVVGIRSPNSPGKFLWVFGNAVPQFDTHGSVIRVITTFSDITEMKNAERAIHQLSTQLLKLQDEERRRIGRELHDGLAQTVLAINLSLAQVRQSLSSHDPAAARSLEKARTLTQQMSREIRTLSYLLHPPLLDDLGLVSALKEYTQGFAERSAISTELIVPSDFHRLPQTIELALFRIVQESLSNIQRHSGSKTAQIRLHQDGSRVILEVSDAGHGLTLPSNGNSHLSEARLGVGIPGMRERIAQLGGQLDIDSGPSGTTVRATIALDELPPAELHDDSSSHLDRG